MLICLIDPILIINFLFDRFEKFGHLFGPLAQYQLDIPQFSLDRSYLYFTLTIISESSYGEVKINTRVKLIFILNLFIYFKGTKLLLSATKLIIEQLDNLTVLTIILHLLP